VTEPQFGRITIGPYTATLSDAAFERTSISKSLDVTAEAICAASLTATDRQTGAWHGIALGKSP
jgi:hypothetical protein